MIFSTPTFLAFLGIVLVAVALARSEVQRRAVLFLASLVFYGWWDWRFCFLIVVASFVDYKLALLIQQAPGRPEKRKWLAISVAMNLGLLAIFKYATWLLASLAGAFSLDVDVPEIPLPLGISFFTFQAMSYTIDVYREKFNPTHKMSEFTFSMSFFPHLIAGPIVRASHFMPQLADEHPLRKDELIEGLGRFARGFVKKTLIADNFAICADAVFSDPTFYSSPTVWLGVIAYSGQIYYDFSGYSDMAIGLARMFGYRFPENFDHPYLSRNITEFWRRWHMSLSSWLRDYLYIALGGNRRGPARTYLNLLATMLLGGLWHGASLTFVVWGGIHGIALAGHKLLLDRWPVPGMVRRVLGPPFTLLLVMVCWVFFRSTSFADALEVLGKMAFVEPDGCAWPHVQSLLALALAVGAHIYVALGREVVFDLRKPPVVAMLLFVLVIDLLYAPSSSSPFIYFQF